MTPRIDTLRNQVAGTAGLLRMVIEELEDLHVLAYERPTAAEEAKVSGGDRDYALDNHGDPAARAAYRLLGDLTATVCADLATASHDALNLLRSGLSPSGGARKLHALELGDLLSAQQRRIAAGDYTPVRRGPQPGRDEALDQMGRRADNLDRTVSKLRKRLDKARGKAS